MAVTRRVALLVATSEYTDPRLRALRAPMREVRELREILLSQGDFDEVETVVEGTKSAIERKIAWLFVNRGPQDLALLYMSCHGRQNDQGWLSFAAKDTELDAPEATSVEAAYVQRRIDESQASAKVVLLDCCFSGAFSAGWVRKSVDGKVSLRDQLAGRGTYIMTASNEFEYAFEGEIQVQNRPVVGSPFTQAILEGIRSGNADRDGDGLITGDELYQYVHDEVARLGRQTPTREAQFEGGFVIAKAPPSQESAPDDRASSDDRPDETRSLPRNRWKARIPVALLVLVVLGQLVFYLVQNNGLGTCVDGKLTVVGSTNYSYLLDRATKEYHANCPGSSFEIDTAGAEKGLDRLVATGKKLNTDQNGGSVKSPELLALSDGNRGDKITPLRERLVGSSLFTLVSNKEAGIHNLSRQQIKDIYAGRITNWAELGGNSLPIRLVGRPAESSTRRTFEQRVLGSGEPGVNSDDCLVAVRGSAQDSLRCERASTADLLSAVASTPGALGYSENGFVGARRDLIPVRIDGQQASDSGTYPFWETGFAYTYGHPQLDSLAASFLNHLLDDASTIHREQQPR